VDARQQLYSIENDRIRLHFHWGQTLAWNDTRRFVLVLSGTQGGKTSFGPWWLWREIQRHGAGDYLAVTTNFPLFMLKMLPEMQTVFCEVLKIGKYWGGIGVIELCNPETGEFTAETAKDKMWGRIILRSIGAPSGLEAATAKAAWLDELGQNEWDESHLEAIMRRLSIHQGRILGTTTVYNSGYLKRRWFDLWEQGDKDYSVIQFPSVVNPAFPKEEYERAKRTLPDWNFDMFYRGIFRKPEGLVYNMFDYKKHVVVRNEREFKRYGLALDEGYTNPAVVLLIGIDSDDRLHVVSEYYKRGKLQDDVVNYARELFTIYMIDTAIADSSAAGLIAAMKDAGIPARGSSGRVIDGIAQVQGILSDAGDGRPRLTVDPSCINTIKEFESYSWKPEKDEVVKENDHAMDALRYFVTRKREVLVAQQSRW